MCRCFAASFLGLLAPRRRPAFDGLFRPFPRERESRYVAIFSSLFSLRLGFKSPFPVNISHSFRTP